MLFYVAYLDPQNAHFGVQTGQRFNTIIRNAKYVLNVHGTPSILLKGRIKIQRHVLSNDEIRHGAKPVRHHQGWMVGVLQANSARQAVIERGKSVFTHEVHDLLDDVGAFNPQLHHVASGLPAAGAHAR